MKSFFVLMRLHQPVGVWLLFYPAAWAMVVASLAVPPATLFGLFLVGALVMRSAGCVINDLVDARFDAQVERTKNRPLASGACTKKQALLLLAVLLVGALLVLWFTPHQPWWLALLAVPMIAAYPFMKRITWWPQVFLALTFNVSALFGWVAVTGKLHPEAWMLYAACAFWTLGYDTIYAMQDVEDDARIGIKSTARKLENRSVWLVGFSYACMVTLLALVGVRLEVMGMAYFLGVAFIATHCVWQVRMVKSQGVDVAGMVFRSNQWLGLGAFFLFLADRYNLMALGTV
jgi:4-hydroxybenzoate polyprenyltransferase